MLRAQKKITKREMKEDTLISSYARLRNFYDINRRNISIGITAVVVVVIAAVIFFNNRSANNVKATAELGKVFSYYDNGQYQIAVDGVPERNIPGLKSIVENYGSTHGGNMAKFYLANAYFSLGKYDDALKMFKDFGPDGQLLTVSQLTGVAACYEAKAAFEDAAEYFEKAAAKYPKDVDAAANLNHAAGNYALAGKKDRALELYKRLKKEYPTTTFAREADRFITQLSG